MSGGFFRGTSADQDTRFSNKQAKLLKSHKFPSELNHLVDMTKVKMDVIRPWIATRVTELLGFEDEVLINFVYGLLDAKEVDGKKIQIQLTGFMEKNTGKFMKELWGLLLSAQNNVSGVPQQFLDAKEEETKKKKAETDRIAQEIQKRRDRDGKEPERERKSRFDGEADGSKFTKAASNSVPKFSGPRDSDAQSEADTEIDGRHDSRAKNGERRKSRSLSVSSQSLKHSISPERCHQSPDRRPLSPRRRNGYSLRRSISPHRRHSPPRTRPPVRRRSPHSRQRSRSRHRSPSPYTCRSLAQRSPRRISRSPLRYRSPFPLRKRSPSPLHRRSPPRRRSSPFRRRSPSPSHHRSTPKARRRSLSPSWRRSPIKNRSVSPARVRSPSPGRRSPPPRSLRRRHGSPFYSPKNHPADSPISPQRKRSPSPYRNRTPSHQNCRSLSGEHDGRANGNESRWYQEEHFSGRSAAKNSPSNRSPERELSERPVSNHKPPSHREPISLQSPQRDTEKQSGNRRKFSSLSPENSPCRSESPIDMQKLNPRTRRSDRQQPVKMLKSNLPSDKTDHKEQAVYERSDGKGDDENNESYRGTESTTRSKRKMDKRSRVDTKDSDSEDASSYRNDNSEKREHKRSDKRKRDHDEASESDSQIEDRKKSKRRRKDDKRLRKEERRRRREEHHFRKLERQTGKMKVKSVDTVSPPSDVEMNHDDSGDSDRGGSRRKNRNGSNADENESEQKRLEIELREKALESLRAKKAISH